MWGGGWGGGCWGGGWGWGLGVGPYSAVCSSVIKCLIALPHLTKGFSVSYNCIPAITYLSGTFLSLEPLVSTGLNLLP